MEPDPRKDHVGLLVYVGVVLCTDSINGEKSARRDLHSGDCAVGRKCNGGIEPDGRGLDK